MRVKRQPTAVGALLVWCLAWTVVAAPAGAQERPDPAAVEVTFSQIDAVPSQEGDVTIVAEVTNRSAVPLVGATGELAVGRRATSRFGLHRVLDAQPDDTGAFGPVQGRVTRAVADVPVDASRYLVVQTSLAELGVAAQRQGVYPLRLTVQAGGSQLGHLTTALVVMPGGSGGEQVAHPLQVGTLVRIDADIDETPLVEDALRRVAQEAGGGQLAEGDHLERLAAALMAAPGPVTIVLDNALAAAVPDVDSVARLLARPGVERVLMPYAGADLVALHRGALTALGEQELQLGAAPWPGTQEGADTDVIAPLAEVDGAVVADLLLPFGVEAIVVGEDKLAIDEERVLARSPGPVRELVGVGRGGDATAVTAIVPDPWVDEALAAGALDVAAVQRVLAETAVVYLERPGQQAPRGTVLRLPSGAAPSAVEALLTAVNGASWLEPVTLADLRSTVAPDGTARLDDDAARAAALPQAYIRDLATAGEALEALRGVVPPDSATVADLRGDLLIAASADFRDAPDTGRRLLRDVTLMATDVLGGVAVVGEPTITFTDSVGQLPVVLANRASVPLQVRVSLSSQRLTFPDADVEVMLEPDTTTTVLIDTEARTPGGTAPVGIVVTDPTGTVQLASGTLVVRIASYPLLALVLVVASALVLVLWWIRDLRRRRRPGTEAA